LLPVISAISGNQCKGFPKNNNYTLFLNHDKHMRGENLSREAIVEMLRRKWDAMQNHLDERGRRIWAATEAQALEP
jgi:hypothetical protein